MWVGRKEHSPRQGGHEALNPAVCLMVMFHCFPMVKSPSEYVFQVGKQIQGMDVGNAVLGATQD